MNDENGKMKDETEGIPERLRSFHGEDLRTRTKKFALRILRLYTALPKTQEAQVLGKQFIRSGTSVGAHLREGHRARSIPEMVSKLELALQELDETTYWLELLVESGILRATRLTGLMSEADELIRILVASVKTTKQSKQQS